MDALTFGQHFNCGWYAERSGNPIYPGALGRSTKYGAVRDFFATYAWPGGTPIVYFDQDNETLCGNCAAKTYIREGIELEGMGVSEASSDITCAECEFEIILQNICSEHGTDTQAGCLDCEVAERNW